VKSTHIHGGFPWDHGSRDKAWILSSYRVRNGCWPHGISCVYCMRTSTSPGWVACTIILAPKTYIFCIVGRTLSAWAIQKYEIISRDYANLSPANPVVPIGITFRFTCWCMWTRSGNSARHALWISQVVVKIGSLNTIVFANTLVDWYMSQMHLLIRMSLKILRPDFNGWYCWLFIQHFTIHLIQVVKCCKEVNNATNRN
jgi:hypothetical protein